MQILIYLFFTISYDSPMLIIEILILSYYLESLQERFICME